MAAAAARGMPSRCSRPPRSPGGHTATVDVDARRADVPGRHRLPGLQRPHLPAPHRAARRARRARASRARCRSRAASTRAGLEWAGTSLRSLFAQPRNALRPAFWRMLRRHRALQPRRRWRCRRRTRAGPLARRVPRRTKAIGVEFRDWYLLPMAAAIWSSPRRDILEFPLATFVRFCRNHGLLQIADRPQWRTVEAAAAPTSSASSRNCRDVRFATPVQRIQRRGGPRARRFARASGRALPPPTMASTAPDCASSATSAAVGPEPAGRTDLIASRAACCSCDVERGRHAQAAAERPARAERVHELVLHVVGEVRRRHALRRGERHLRGSGIG